MNCLLLAQLANKRPRVAAKRNVGELTESIRLAFGVGGPRVRRKQHGSAQAVFVAPLDGLYNKFPVAGAAPTSQKKVGRNIEGDGFAIKCLTTLERIEGVGCKDVISQFWFARIIGAHDRSYGLDTDGSGRIHVLSPELQVLLQLSGRSTVGGRVHIGF